MFLQPYGLCPWTQTTSLDEAVLLDSVLKIDIASIAKGTVNLKVLYAEIACSIEFPVLYLSPTTPVATRVPARMAINTDL